MKTISSWAVALIIFWSLPALSSDREPTPEEKEEAARAFQAGQALSQKGEYLQAAAEFERAYRLHSHPSVLGNIGQCYNAVGDYPRAVEAFRKYFESPNPDAPEFNKEAAEILRKLEPKVGSLNVRCRSQGCFVTVDNESRGMAPIDVVLLPGEHNVEVENIDEKTEEHFQVTVHAGRATVLEAEPTPASPRLRPPFWVLTGATIVGGGATAVLGGLNLKTIRECEDGGSTDTALQERGNRLNLATAVAGGVTGVLGLTAIILAVVDLKRNPEKKGDPPHTSLRPFMSTDFAGGAHVGVTVSFY